SAKAFTTISLFNMLQYPFTFLPMGLNQYNQSLVGIKRIINFLDAEEIIPYIQTDGESPKLEVAKTCKTTSKVTTNVEVSDDELAIAMECASLGWLKENGVVGGLSDLGRPTETTIPSQKKEVNELSTDLKNGKTLINRSIHT